MNFRINSFVGVFYLAVLVCSGMYGQQLNADQAEPSIAADKQIIGKLKAARPDLRFTVVGPAPIADFYEVQVENGPLFFVHSNGEHFFQGGLFQVQSGRIVDVLESRLVEKRRTLFAERSPEDMIVFKPEGKTAAIMNIFTDVDCGYCRKLHQEVPQLNAMGIEVRYLAYPRAGIPSGSYSKIATAWCAEDQQTTLTRVKNGQSVPVDVCEDNPVAEHYALGDTVGVTGTPAIVLMDGTLIPGYQPAENFARLLGLNPTDG